MKTYLAEHRDKYPHMQVADAVKLLYQSEFGGGHMIAEEKESLQRIKEEWSRQKPAGTIGCRSEMVEPIGDGMCRIYLDALEDGLAPETLNRLFVLTAREKKGSRESLEEKLELLREMCQKGQMPFEAEELDQYLEEYQRKDFPAVSHSEVYRSEYHPAYRIVSEDYARYYSVLTEIDKACHRAGDKKITVAIDGMCGSGKSTLGQTLEKIYDCNLFHMDDFFLQPYQRTPERYAEPGGNVDYERFQEEILNHMDDENGFTYQVFDCSRMSLGEYHKVPRRKLNIIEGVYSQHPYFGDVYDLRFFYHIEEEEQLRRIERRNGPEMMRRFQTEWIPLEEKYFEACGITDKSIVI